MKAEIEIRFQRCANCGFGFELVHCGTITSVTRYGFRQILHADQNCNRFYVWFFGNLKRKEDMRF